MIHVRAALAALSLAVLGGGAEAASPKMKGTEFAHAATIDLAAARRIALKVRPGTVTDSELEQEKGGSGLRYSFDITSQGKAYEVGVDAKTGAVLENVAEGKNPD